MGVTMFDFLSDKLGYHTKLYVILPGCVNQGKKPAGTLYLLHGGGGNSQDWIRFSSIERYAEEKKLCSCHAGSGWWMLLQRYEIWIPILSVCDRGSSNGS
ncbi:MAG: hypothetical protein ACLTBA_09720 [Roseburia intestinalis]